ncbi:MAG: OmpA family protein [Kiloniellales bacterium]
MSNSRFAYPRTRAVLLTTALAAPLLAAGCGHQPYASSGKSLQAVPASDIFEVEKGDGLLDASLVLTEPSGGRAMSPLRVAADETGASKPRSSEIADPPMPSAPLGKSVAAQMPRDDKPAALASTGNAMQKPQSGAAAPSVTAPKAATLVAVAPKAATPAAAAAEPARESSALPTKPAMTPEEKEALRARAAELFLDPEPAQAQAPQPKTETAAKSPAEEPLQPAHPAARSSAMRTTEKQPSAPATKAASTATATQRSPETSAAKNRARATAAPTAIGQSGALPEVNVSTVPLKLPPKSHPDQDRAEQLTAAARVAPAAGSGSKATPEVEIATPSGQTRVLFEAASAVLSKEAQAELAELAKQITDPAQFRITILGYGDGGAQPADASRARVLALTRVMAVRQFLMVRGLPAESLSARAMGNQMTGGPASRVDVMVSQL